MMSRKDMQSMWRGYRARLEKIGGPIFVIKSAAGVDPMQRKLLRHRLMTKAASEMPDFDKLNAKVKERRIAADWNAALRHIHG